MSKKIHFIIWSSLILILTATIFIMNLFRIRSEPPSIEDFVNTLPIEVEKYPYQWSIDESKWIFSYKTYEYLKGQFSATNINLQLTEHLYEDVPLYSPIVMEDPIDSGLVKKMENLDNLLEEEFNFSEDAPISVDLENYVILKRKTQKDEYISLSADGEAIWGNSQEYQQFPWVPSQLIKEEASGKRWHYYDKPDEEKSPDPVSDIVPYLLSKLFANTEEENKEKGKTPLGKITLHRFTSPEIGSTVETIKSPLVSLKLWEGKPASSFYNASGSIEGTVDSDSGEGKEMINTFLSEVESWRVRLIEIVDERLREIDEGIKSKLSIVTPAHETLENFLDYPEYLVAKSTTGDEGSDCLITFNNKSGGLISGEIIQLGGSYQSGRYRIEISDSEYFDPKIISAIVSYRKLYASAFEIDLEDYLSHRSQRSTPDLKREPFSLISLDNKTSDLPGRIDFRLSSANTNSQLISTDQLLSINLNGGLKPFQDRLIKAKDELKVLIENNKRTLDDLEELRRDLLGPISSNAILSGKIDTKDGSSTLEAIAQIVDFEEIEGQTGKFRLKLALRESGSLLEQVIAIGQVDISDDVSGVINQYINARNKLNSYIYKESLLSRLLDSAPLVEEAIAEKGPEPKKYENWNPDEEAFAVRVRAPEAQLSNTTITNAQDGRLLMRINKNSLSGESIATRVRFDEVDSSLNDRYAKAQNEMREKLEAKNLWISNDKLKSLELLSIFGENGLIGIKAAIYNRGRKETIVNYMGVAGPVVKENGTIEKRIELSPMESKDSPLAFIVDLGAVSAIRNSSLKLSEAPDSIRNLEIDKIYKSNRELDIVSFSEAAKIQGYKGFGIVAGEAIGKFLGEEDNDSGEPTWSSIIKSTDDPAQRKRLENASTKADAVNAKYRAIGLRDYSQWQTLDPQNESLFFVGNVNEKYPLLYKFVKKRPKKDNYELNPRPETIALERVSTWSSRLQEVVLSADLEPGFYVLTTSPIIVDGTGFPFQILEKTENQ